MLRSIENGPFVGRIAPPTDPRLAPAPPLHHGGGMARISYDETTAAGYKAVRELPREGLADWRDAVERHLRPTPGMTLVDIGAGTGQFSSALGDWFDIDVIAVEPSDAMRARIPRTPRIEPREGEATSLPLADESVDAAWMSLVIHHVADLEAAA